MAGARIGVVTEQGGDERRVACVPAAVPHLQALGLQVLVQRGAGAGAWHEDAAYTTAGATVVTPEELDRVADVLLCVGAPAPDRLAALAPGRVVVGLLDPLGQADQVSGWAAAGLTTLALDLLPRELAAARPMDALASQAGIAGHQAALAGIRSHERRPGCAPPRVLVMGCGTTGLAAVGTARRLGADVTGYDVCADARAQVGAMGAVMLGHEGLGEAGPGDAPEAPLPDRLGGFDVVITTVRTPGRRPPLLVPEAGLAAMSEGSLAMDLAASPLGGNVAGSVPGSRVLTSGGVSVIGADRLAGTMPAAASAAYSRNLVALLTHLTRDGRVVVDPTDPITGNLIVTHGGQAAAAVGDAVRRRLVAA